MSLKYEVRTNEKLGRYLVAAKDLKPGERILDDKPFVLGPSSDTSLVCFNCYLPLINKFLVCKNCAVAPVCPGDGCSDRIKKWHTQQECEFFRNLKLTKGINPMTMVQNVGSLLVLRVMLKKESNPQEWKLFMELETHLDRRRDSSVWDYYDNTVKFIQSLGLLENGQNQELVQKICAAIDVNSFEVRGPPVPAIGCAERLRAVYLRAALLAHDCSAGAHVAIADDNALVCHAAAPLPLGAPICYNYTDALQGTAMRQQHLMIGKYFKCTCARCSDITELGTYMSSALCPQCKTGYISKNIDAWMCNSCGKETEKSVIEHKIKCCSDKLEVINKKDDRELEEYIRNVSLVLAPNHYLLLDAKQRLAGVLRDIINREPRPTKKVMRRKIELCREIIPVLEVLSPGICRTKDLVREEWLQDNNKQETTIPILWKKNTVLLYFSAITLYELHATIVQLAKKMFDAREIPGSAYLDELLNAEKYLKKSLEMLVLEPGNSPEGELCAKALEEYRALKISMAKVMDAIHAQSKTYQSENIPEELYLHSEVD